MSGTHARPQLVRTALVLERCHGVLGEIIHLLRDRTERGVLLDDRQVEARRLAQLVTEFEAVAAIANYAEWLAQERQAAPAHERLAATAVAQFALHLRHAVADTHEFHHVHKSEAFRAFEDEEIAAFLHEWTTIQRIAELGEDACNNQFDDAPIRSAASDDAEMRDATRRFAAERVAPLAEAIHREDRLVPEDLIAAMAEMGYFGMSIPTQFGGVGMGNVAMVVATEELSAASLSAAGSLMTRPEILAKALLEGGSDRQKAQWLPRIASGECMVAVAVTEPDVGSDVAALSCRATPVDRGGIAGYALQGAKAWSTFAGRANMLALLARTDPDSAKGHKGLSLFIVEKPTSRDHAFAFTQDGGGSLTGKADATMGYRGMHSFTLQFDDWFVPAECLVGEGEGMGKGFYLQMDGFAAGRLQTGGRAVGVAQAALHEAMAYTTQRPQFGKAIVEYQSTRYELGHMAIRVATARQLTHAAARAFDEGSAHAGQLAAMAKLYACRAAVEVTQRAQVLHGGWGYAEEYAISRHVADALVLPLFEGVEPILEMKVIARGILSA